MDEFSSKTHEVPADVAAGWQKILNLTALIYELPAALIMRLDRPYIEVFKASSNPDNPYAEGERKKVAGLYCEKTISQEGELEIVNALEEEEWQPDNPDIEMGLISYLGLPLIWPDGETFGTICVLGREARKFTAEEKELLQQFKVLVEADLKLIEQQNRIKRLIRDKEKQEKELKRSKRLLEQSESLAGTGGWEYIVAEDRFYWTDELFRLHGFPVPDDSNFLSNFLKAGHMEKSLELYPEPYREQIATSFRRAVEEGESYDLEVRFISARGQKMWVRTVGMPITDSSGKVVRVVGTFIDITESKEIHFKLQERVKELDCLHTIAKYLADNKLTLPEIFNRIIRLLPGYFRKPDRTEVRIIYQDEVFCEDNFTETQNLISCPIKVNDKIEGQITAFYFGDAERENISASAPSLFLPEEKNLLDTVANELAIVIEKKEIEKARKADNLKLASILNSLSTNICVLDSEGNIKDVNQSWLDFAQENEAEIERVTPGTNYLEVCQKSLDEERETALEFARGIRDVISGKKDFFELEYPCHSPEEKRWFVGRVTPLAGSEKEGRRGVVIAHENITERKERQERIRYLSYHDSLTGFYNRSFFELELKRLDTRRQLPLTIIVADINGLEIINAGFGRDRGDNAIKKAAEILQEVVRKEDILARWGGDEFILLLPQTDAGDGQIVIDRIKKQCQLTNDQEIPISLGVGMAVKEDINQDINKVISQAEKNMKQNKLLDKESSENRIIRNLLRVLGTKSHDTEEHAFRMADLANELGKRLGLNNKDLNNLSLLASLHDIGKTFIPEEILKKPGDLSPEEWVIMEKHTIKGAEIAAATEEFAGIAAEIKAHHEWWDGTGYPEGLAGEEIPYLSRIIAIVDAYDVMTSERPYKKAISREKALEEIERCAGSQFDPEAARTFVEMMQEKSRN